MDTFLGSSDDYSTVAHNSSASSELNEVGKESSSIGNVVEPGGRQKKGKASAAVKAAVVDISESTDYCQVDLGKIRRKARMRLHLHASESKTGAKKGHKSAEEIPNVLSNEWIIHKVLTLFPDFQEQGVDDSSELLESFAKYFGPLLMNYIKEKRKAVFSENAERMKQMLDNLQKKVDEAFLNLQLYEKALDLFEDDQSVSVVLRRHLLRTVASAMANTHFVNLDIYVKLKSGLEVEGSQDSEVSLKPGERMALVKNFPGTLAKKAFSVEEALEGERVDLFLTVFRELAEESGLNLKKLDKKLERTVLHSYRNDLAMQVSTENDLVSRLPKVVSLLYIQVYNKALQAFGMVVSIAITSLKDKLNEQEHKILLDYHAAAVTLLALISASSNEDNYSGDVISTKERALREYHAIIEWLSFEQESNLTKAKITSISKPQLLKAL